MLVTVPTSADDAERLTSGSSRGSSTRGGSKGSSRRSRVRRLGETGSGLSRTSGLTETGSTTVSVGTSVDRVNDSGTIGTVVRSDHGRVRKACWWVEDKGEIGSFGCEQGGS